MPNPLVRKTLKAQNQHGQPSEVELTEDVQSHEDPRFSDKPLLGMSKGVTLNMGDYQSMRIDVWLSVPVKKSNAGQYDYLAAAVEAVGYIDKILDKEIEKETE